MNTMNDLQKNLLSGMGVHNIIKHLVSNVDDDVPLARIRDKMQSGTFAGAYMCGGCSKSSSSATLFQCSRCKSMKYCSKKCQKLDWIGQGNGPTKGQGQMHKDLCSVLAEANDEFDMHPTAGARLRTEVFPSWADQHHESGAFFMTEFLARKKLLGGHEVGFWAMQDSGGLPYQEAKRDVHGFLNGQMLLDESFPTLAKGWTASLRPKEYPTSDAPSRPIPKDGLTSWEDYVRIRSIKRTSIAPLLLTNVLTVYHMIFHKLKLQEKKKKLCVYLLGVEVELNQIPLFGELVHLLPSGVELELIFLSEAAKAICAEARLLNNKKSILLKASNKNEGYVLGVSAADSGGSGQRRVCIKLDSEYQYFHEINPSTFASMPDAVLGLNAGLPAYDTWTYTVHMLLVLKIPFSFSDQTIVTQRNAKVNWFPFLVKGFNHPDMLRRFPSVRIPTLEISLNPFHGIVGRDVAAVLVPNINNGYLLTCTSP